MDVPLECQMSSTLRKRGNRGARREERFLEHEGHGSKEATTGESCRYGQQGGLRAMSNMN
jgi:hypothetical protein